MYKGKLYFKFKVPELRGEREMGVGRGVIKNNLTTPNIL
jgi:hypothetical protein